MEYFLSIFFKAVMIFFTIASTLLAGYSIQNKYRLRKVRLSWRAGKMAGYPLFATVFLGLICSLGVLVYLTEDSGRYGVLACYVWIGCMWFISSYLASKHYITDYGIAKNINDPSQTIPWFQILDYVEKEDRKNPEYTFTYFEMDKSLVDGYKQLRLTVPENKYKAFKKIISLKLENRFEGTYIPDIDIKRIQED
ncbi:MAG: hypothetical protein FH748_02625 [Balneolaceae bacterium]|nr:hypothetical protein [Balneolaceae bacterium]